MDPLALIGAKKKTKKGNEASLEVTIDLAKPTRSTFPCFDFNEIKKKADYHDGLSDSDDERFHDPEALRMFKILQEKYATKRDKKGRKRNIGCVDDYIDKAAGYDLEDAFIDDSEAFDTLVPSTMEPIKRGFYVNREKLEFRPVAGAEASDSEDEEEQPPEPKKRKVKPVEDVSNQPSTSAAVAAPAPAPVARLSNGAPPTARLSNGAAPSRMAGQPPSKKAAIQSSAGPTKKPTTVTAPPAKPTVATDTEKDDEELDTTAPADESRGELANVSSDVSTSSASKAPYSDELVNRIRAFQGSVQQGKARQRLSLDQVKLIQRVDDQMLSEEMRPHAKSKVMDQLAEYAGLNKVTLTKLLQKHKEYLQNGSPMETDWESSLVPAKPKQAAPINPQTAQLHNLLESLKANKSAEAQDLLKSFIKSKAPGSPLSSKLPASVIASLSSAQKPGLTTAQKPSSPAAQKPGPSNASQKHAQSVFLKPPQPSPTPQSKTTPATPPVSSKPPVLTAQKPQPAQKPQSAQKPVQKAISSKSSTSSSSLDGIKTFRDFKVRFDALKSKQKDLAPGVAVHRVTELIMSTLQCDKKDASVCAIKAFSGGDHYKMVMQAVEDYMKKHEEAAKQAANGSSKNAPLSTIRAENVQNTMHNAAKPIKKPSTNSAPPKLTRMEPETITIDDSDEVQIIE